MEKNKESKILFYTLILFIVILGITSLYLLNQSEEKKIISATQFHINEFNCKLYDLDYEKSNEVVTSEYVFTNVGLKRMDCFRK